MPELIDNFTEGMLILLMKRVLTYAAAILIVCVAPSYAAIEGADTYKAKCAICHGQDGGGNTPVGQRMKIRDLRSTEVQKQGDAALTAIIAKGQKAMPAFSKSLTSEQIKDLVGYVRSIAAK